MDFFLRLEGTASCPTADTTCQRGFVLAEFLLALFIVSFALLGLANIFTKSLTSTSVSRQMSVATTLAGQKIEAVKNLKEQNKYAEIVNEGPVTLPDGYTRQTVIDPIVSPEGKKVTVTMRWAGNTHSVNLSTIVTKK